MSRHSAVNQTVIPAPERGGAGQPWTLTCVEPNHYMTPGERSTLSPLSSYHYLLNLLGCTNSTSIITFRLAVCPQYLQYNAPVCLPGHKHHTLPPVLPILICLCVFLKSTILTHTHTHAHLCSPPLPPSLLPSLCDLLIFPASLGCCCLFSVSCCECLAPNPPQGSRHREIEGKKWRSTEQRKKKNTGAETVRVL